MDTKLQLEFVTEYPKYWDILKKISKSVKPYSDNINYKPIENIEMVLDYYFLTPDYMDLGAWFARDEKHLHFLENYINELEKWKYISLYEVMSHAQSKYYHELLTDFNVDYVKFMTNRLITNQKNVELEKALENLKEMLTTLSAELKN